MSKEGNVFGPDRLINPSNPDATRVAGEDYEYIYGTYAKQFQEQLEAMKAQKELLEEDRRENSLFGERNMAILNMALAARDTTQSIRDKYIQNRRDSLGTISNMGTKVDERETIMQGGEEIKNPNFGKWITADGDTASFVPKEAVTELTAWEKAKENLFGWKAGDIKLDDGSVPTKAEVKKKVKPKMFGPGGVFGRKKAYADNSVVGDSEEMYDDTGNPVTSDVTIETPSDGDKIIDPVVDTSPPVDENNSYSLAKKISSGTATRDEVLNFQENVGIDVDGMIGNQTMGASLDVLGISDDSSADLPPDKEWTNISTSNQEVKTDSLDDFLKEETSTASKSVDIPVSVMTEKFQDSIRNLNPQSKNKSVQDSIKKLQDNQASVKDSFSNDSMGLDFSKIIKPAKVNTTYQKIDLFGDE
tara:strand:+ start:11904 stop:13154 length:1251 start_codon:yes stop_codon:yes gene_type:complete